MSRHGFHRKISNGQGDGWTFSFYIREQMLHFTGGKQRNKDHKRRVVGKKGLIFVVYILSASQLITIDKKG